MKLSREQKHFTNFSNERPFFSSYRNLSVDLLSKANKKCYKHFNNRVNHGNILEYKLYLINIIEDLYRLQM